MSAVEKRVDLASRQKLIRDSWISEQKRSRICLHHNHSDFRQEMIIRIEKQSYIAPHRQLGKTKTYVQLEGEMYLVFFDGKGKYLESDLLKAWGEGTSIVRFDASIWHTVLPLNNESVYIETIEGPYNSKDTDYAAWAPTEDDGNGNSWLRKKVKPNQDL